MVAVTVSDGACSTMTDPNGEYAINDVPNGTYTVKPSMWSFTFTQASRSVTIKDEGVSGVNFTAKSSGGGGGGGDSGGG